ncbi:hypothetical protein T484DRAFT_2023575 [Baffinella frigidus]|nr:hypothetical protein T484DRAFT_2023575 [Cryptophyta sp. CCMP2293]|mmetsp:Transcript_28799/g.68689  ORF Transcript_28799/g.68689 Transcript_28799/m.68689 type:complete len:120 (+) Transcript_28799:56-415(+)
MTCSFCKTDEPRAHNVRTCMSLKAAILVFMSYKGASFFFDSFKEACAGALGVALDVVLTGGMATAMSVAYAAYNECKTAVDMGTLATLSKRGQAKYLIDSGCFGSLGDNADAIAGEIVS